MADLLERLEHGSVICAEGYLFELERRGYLQAGGFVPEVVLENPDKVAELHREFVHAGSDVVEAFTYYAHREKLRLIGKEYLLEEINRRALEIAKEVATESGTLLAGNVCNTNVYGGEESRETVRGMFAEQVGWAAEAGVDFVVGETFSWLGEALVATEVIKQAGLPAVVTLIAHKDPRMRDGASPAEACKRLEAAGADVVGLNCGRGPETLLPLLAEVRDAVSVPVAALPVPYRTTEEQPSFQSLEDPHARDLPGGRAFPDRARPVHLQPLRDRRVHPGGVRAGRPLPRRLLRRGAAPHPQHGRGARTHPAGEPIHGRHVEARLPRQRPDAEGRVPRVCRAALARRCGWPWRRLRLRWGTSTTTCAAAKKP